MDPQDTGITGAHETGALDIVDIPQGGKGRAGDAGKARDKYRAQGQHHIILLTIKSQ